MQDGISKKCLLHIACAQCCTMHVALCLLQTPEHRKKKEKLSSTLKCKTNWCNHLKSNNLKDKLLSIGYNLVQGKFNLSTAGINFSLMNWHHWRLPFKFSSSWILPSGALRNKWSQWVWPTKTKTRITFKLQIISCTSKIISDKQHQENTKVVNTINYWLFNFYLSNVPLTLDSNIIASFATEFGGITWDKGDVWRSSRQSIYNTIREIQFKSVENLWSAINVCHMLELINQSCFT